MATAHSCLSSPVGSVFVPPAGASVPSLALSDAPELVAGACCRRTWLCVSRRSKRLGRSSIAAERGREAAAGAPGLRDQHMHRKIQTAATTMVIFVNRSPALVPKALCPPMPPKAPARPPPRPCWINTNRIKNSDNSTSRIAKKVNITALPTTVRKLRSAPARCRRSRPPSGWRRRPAPRRCSAATAKRGHCRA